MLISEVINWVNTTSSLYCTRDFASLSFCDKEKNYGQNTKDIKEHTK